MMQFDERVFDFVRPVEFSYHKCDMAKNKRFRLETHIIVVQTNNEGVVHHQLNFVLRGH